MKSPNTRFRSSRTLSRYIFWQILGAFLVVLASITIVTWIVGALDHLRWVINNGLPFLDYMYYNFLIVPRSLTTILSPSAVIAVLFVYHRLTADHELVAMNAAGLSNIRVATGAFAFATLMSGLLAVHMSYLSPFAYYEFRVMGEDVRNAGLVLNLKEKEFTSVAEKLAIYVGKRHSSSEFEDVMVWETEDPDAPLAMLADQAKLVFDHGRAFFVLSDGMQQSYERGKASISFSNFEQYTFNLEKYIEEQRPERGNKERELVVDQLWAMFTNGALGSKYHKEINNRIASVLKPLATVIGAVAILICGPLNRRGQMWRLVSAVGLMFIVEAVFAMLLNMSKGAVTATYGIFLITAVIASGGIWLIANAPLRMGRPTWRFGARPRAAT